jgi:multidrug efflux pump subunit AcrA (membrane-fusion protein)
VYVEAGGRAEKREVTLGGTQGGARQVTGGVSPGENVIVEASPALADGVAVRIKEKANT